MFPSEFCGISYYTYFVKHWTEASIPMDPKDELVKYWYQHFTNRWCPLLKDICLETKRRLYRSVCLIFFLNLFIAAALWNALTQHFSKYSEEKPCSMLSVNISVANYCWQLTIQFTLERSIEVSFTQKILYEA